MNLFNKYRATYSPEGPAGGGGGEPSTPAAAPSTASTAPSSSSAPSGDAPKQSSSPQVPTRATEPAEATQPASRESSSAGDDSLFDFGEDFLGDDAEIEISSKPATEAEPQTAPPSEQAAPPPQQAEAPQQAQPKEQPAPQASPSQAGPQEAGAQTTQAAPTASLPSPAEPNKIAESLNANFDAIADHLSSEQFKLSKEDLEALENDVAATVPKLLAKTFLRAQITALNQMSRVVPAMFEAHQRVLERRNASESKFYSRWPSIKKEVHGDVVQRYARTYRQMNPQASLEQMVNDVGPMVMIAAGIPMTQAPSNGAGAPALASQPAAVRSPPPSPFRPAVSGAAPPQQAPQEGDEWSGLGGDHDE